MFVHVSLYMQQKILPDNQCGLDNSNHIIIQEAESQIEQFSSCLLHKTVLSSGITGQEGRTAC